MLRLPEPGSIWVTVVGVLKQRQHCASATGSSSADHVVYLTDVAVNTDGPTSTVVLTGAIGDSGTGTTIHPDGTPDPEHSSQLELRLTEGTIRIDIAELHSRFAKAFQQQFPPNGASCSGHVTAGAPTRIIEGTGAYGDSTGSFDLTMTLDEVDKLPTCDGTGAFVAQTIVIAGAGIVSLK